MSDDPIHIATYEEKRGVLQLRDPETGKSRRVHGVFYRYRCLCGQIGSEWYFGEKEHARRAFHVHASFADRRRYGPTRGNGRHVVRVNGKEIE